MFTFIETWVMFSWACQDYWPALVFALLVMVVGLWRPAADSRLGGWIGSPQDWRFLPVAVWCFLANRDLLLVADSHSSVYPNLLYSSYQRFCLSIVILGIVFGAMLFPEFIRRGTLRAQTLLRPRGFWFLVIATILDWHFAFLAWLPFSIGQ